MAVGIAALAVAVLAGASSASAQCNPVNRLSAAHIAPDAPPRDRINAIMSRFAAEPQLYDLLGCPVNYFGTSKGGGAFIPFDRGVVYAPPGLRVVEIHGAILEKWAEYDYEFGLLGYPTSDELPWGNNDGRYSKFEGGRIIWTPGGGAHAVYGAIGESHRGRGGRLAPLTEEVTSNGGKNNCPKYHRQQTFTDLAGFGLTNWVACWDANTGRVTWQSYAIPLNVPNIPNIPGTINVGGV